MGTLTERLAVVVDAKTGGAVSEMRKLSSESDKAHKSTSKIGDGMKASETQISRSSLISKDALKAGIATGAAVAGIAVVKFGLDAAHATSDLNESVSKAGVVFGRSADQVIRFGDTAAKSVGLSKQAAIEAAATFGNLFVALKVGQQPAADMSTKLIQLSGDLASFNNVDPAQVLEDLRSGLLGETEPLRKYGVALNAASVEQEAMKETGKKSAAQLTEGEKVIARYKLILDNTTTAQGDFGRTANGLANSQRIANAQFKDFQANVGKLFIPILSGATHAANDLLGPLNGLATAATHIPPGLVDVAKYALLAAGAMKLMQFAGKGLGPLLSAGVDKLAIDFSGMSLEANAAGREVKTLGDRARVLAGNLPLVGAAAVVSVVGIKKLKDELGDLGAKILGFKTGKTDFHAPAEGARDLSDVLTVLSQQGAKFEPGLLTNKLTLMAASMADLTPQVKLLGRELGSNIPSEVAFATGAFKGLDASLAELAGSNAKAAAIDMQKITDTLIAQGVNVSTIKSLFPQYTEALKVNAAAAKIDATNIALTGDKAKAAAEKLDHYRKVLMGIADTSLDAASADINFRDSVAQSATSLTDLTQAVKDATGAAKKKAQQDLASAKALDVNTQAGRDQAKIIIGQIENAKAAAQTVKDHAHSLGQYSTEQDKYDNKLADGIRTIRENAKALGLNKDQVDRLVGAYAKLPTHVETKVAAPGAKSAADLMNAATKAANGIPQSKSTKVDAKGVPSAVSQMDAATRAANGIPAAKTVTVKVNDSDAVRKVNDFNRLLTRLDGRRVSTYLYNFQQNVALPAAGKKGYSHGGVVTGGLAGRDSVNALLMPGERVLTVAQNAAYERGSRALSLPSGGGGGGNTYVIQVTPSLTASASDIQTAVMNAIKGYETRNGSRWRAA